MPSTPWIPAVAKVANRTDVSAEVVNPILEQYTQRTQHLYEKFNEFSGRSVLVAYDQVILDVADVTVGSAVYFNKDGGVVGLSLAKAQFEADSVHNSSFAVSNTGYAVGIVKAIKETDNTADVYLYGMVEFDTRINDDTAGILESSLTTADEAEAFEPGPLYLSRSESGKLTRNPGGVAIYVGYALDKYRIALSPNVNEFSAMFTQYFYSILDRPAGKPSLGGSTWTIGSVDTSCVGWVPVADVPDGYVVPDGAVFFYNIPANEDIDLDTGITTAEQEESKSLALVLPPFPPHLTFLTNNGVVQMSQDFSTTDGIYKIDQYGIWWFTDEDGYQPWANDITTSLTVVPNFSTDVFSTASAHGLTNGDRVKIASSGTIPTGLNGSIYYYVIAADTLTFQLSTTINGTAALFSDNGTGTVNIPCPYIWKINKGSDENRARLFLQFAKLNPDLRELFVTSLAPFHPNSTALKLYSREANTREAAVGNLLFKLDLEPVEETAVSAATGVSDITFDPATGKLTKTIIPVVSVLEGDSNVQVTESATKPGYFKITSGNGSAYGRVQSIEPDNVRLEVLGLHTYLNFPNPATNPAGSITGKFLLPANSPVGDLKFTLFLFGASSSSGGSIGFNFSYAITRHDALVTSAMTTSAVTVSLPNPYVANTCVKLTNSISIPSSAIAADTIVNFRLTRTVSTYISDIGLVDLYWKIE